MTPPAILQLRPRAWFAGPSCYAQVKRIGLRIMIDRRHEMQWSFVSIGDRITVATSEPRFYAGLFSRRQLERGRRWELPGLPTDREDLSCPLHARSLSAFPSHHQIESLPTSRAFIAPLTRPGADRDQPKRARVGRFCRRSKWPRTRPHETSAEGCHRHLSRRVPDDLGNQWWLGVSSGPDCPIRRHLWRRWTRMWWQGRRVANVNRRLHNRDRPIFPSRHPEIGQCAP